MIADLKPYPAMKDSGVEWLGDVPEHWEVLSGRACVYEKEEPNIGMVEDTVLSLSYGRIIVKPKEKLRGLVPESYETYQVIDPGDVICRPTDLQNDRTSLRFGIAKDRGIITSAYMCLGVQDRLYGRFGHLLFHAYDLKKIFYGFGSGLRQNLSWEDFKYLSCVVPPLPEQAAVVRYLDHVDRQVRRLVRAKRKLIALLTEQKQAIIHRAVTRGLDPDVPLKDSGIEWLGEVPEHWDVPRLKTVFAEADERTVNGEETLFSLRMHQGLVPHNDVSDKPISSEDLIGYKMVKPGQLVMNRMRAAIGIFGVPPRAGLVSPDYAVFDPAVNLELGFFLRLFKSRDMCSAFRVASKGLGTGSSGFMRLYTDQFGVLRTPFPPVEEQAKIVEYLNSATNEVDTAISRAELEIELLHEYRTRIIADVVTGKLDVREPATALPDVDPLDAADDPDNTLEAEADLDAIPEEAEA